MIASRSLRWSSQTIGIGRRRIETYSARQFSSSTIQHAPIRANSLLSTNNASLRRSLTKVQLSAATSIICNGSGVRFASTAPGLPTAPAATTANVSAAVPTEAVGSSAAPLPSDFITDLGDATEFDPQALHNIPETIGYLKSLGLEYGYGPTAMMEWILEHIHVFAGTPWWASIALTAVFVRAVLFKFYIGAAENGTRMQTIQPLTKPLTDQMNKAMKDGKSDEVWRLRSELSLMNKRAGIKMWKSFIPMLQAVSGFGTFFLLRAMSKIPVPGLEDGGMLWFSNLTIPDPYFILPITTSVVLHQLLKRGGETGVSNFTPGMVKFMTYAFPGMSFLFTWWLPASVQLSFFISGLCSAGQGALFKSPRFRNFFKMTPIPAQKGVTASPSPYKGKLKLAAGPLSQKELNSRFQGAGVKPVGSQVEEVKSSLSKFSPPTLITEAKSKYKDVLKYANETMDSRRVKGEAKEHKEYEKKMREAEKKARVERDLMQRAERAARRREAKGQ